MATSDPDLPPHALDAASFAETMARDYIGRGGDAKDLFVALAGAVASYDKRMGAHLLAVMEEMLLRDPIRAP